MLKPQLTIVDDPTLIDGLSEYLADKEYVTFDTETNGVHKGAEIIGMSFCAEETKAYYVILAAWDTDTSTLIGLSTKNRAKELVEALKGKKLIMHNAVFDCAMVESNFKVSLIEDLHTDTMVLAHLLNENRRIGLKELAKEYFGADATAEQAAMKASVLANGGLLTKKTYEMYKADPYLMAEYGAMDALLTYKLFNVMLPELYEQKLDKFFYEDESMPLLKGSTYELNTAGLQVDSKALLTLKKTLEAECAEAKSFVLQETTPYVQDKYPGNKKTNTFNIGSSQQLSWLLFGVLNLEFGTLTKGGKAIAKDLGLKTYSAAEKRHFIAATLRLSELSRFEKALLTKEEQKSASFKKRRKYKDPWAYIACDKTTLTRLAPKYKFIDRLLEYQRKTKLLNTYVEGIEERTTYGIIQPSFLQTGTTSGRYSSRNPNFQNLPRDDKRIKSCIIARPGKVFVGADYSQLEPRVFAYYSGDERLLQAFHGSDDFYSVIGMEVYNKTDCTPRKDGTPDAFGIKYKKLRDLSKVIALASTYGATANQLMKTTGKSKEDTQVDIDAYFDKFPGVAQMMLDAHATAKKDGQVTNLFGRPRRIPEAKTIDRLYGKQNHADYDYNVRSLLNLAVNHRIQSTGASIVNRAAIAFNQHCKDIGVAAKLVLQVHDSLIAECAEADADTVSLILQHSMENTVQLEGIALEAIPKTGRTLADV